MGRSVTPRPVPLEMLRKMFLIRRFDEEALRLRLAGRIRGTIHPYHGEEAIAVGVCAALEPNDRIVSNHRGHGHCIAKGADIGRMMAEILGRRDGFCGGKGGSMHIADFGVGILGANGIVAAGMPIAAGSALAAKLRDDGCVTIGFFGDGATGEGAFHEALNISAVWGLPVVWVCENNQYAVDTNIRQAIHTTDIASFAAAYSMPGFVVDGNDVLAVEAAARPLVERARAGGGPALIECKTYRYGVHAQRGTPIPEWRSTEELAAWRERDPIPMFEAWLTSSGTATPAEIADVRAQVDADLARAVAYGEASPFPAPEEALQGLFVEGSA
jgi:TPP-dependent pyruvate/acetoin dehydrogenase alpha subunit